MYIGILGQAFLSGACRDTVIGISSVTNKQNNSRIEILAVQIALLWPCFFLFQQVPLARIFLVIVITARSLRVVCM